MKKDEMLYQEISSKGVTFLDCVEVASKNLDFVCEYTRLSGSDLKHDVIEKFLVGREIDEEAEKAMANFLVFIDECIWQRIPEVVEKSGPGCPDSIRAKAKKPN